MAEKLIKRADYVAHRHARMGTRAFQLYDRVSNTLASAIPEEHPHAQAMMRVWMRFTDDIVGEFGPLAVEEANKPVEAAK